MKKNEITLHVLSSFYSFSVKALKV